MARHHFLTSRSRRLRRDSTDAAKKLWSILRNRQLGGFKFRQQVEIDGYVADPLCAERRPIIEVDGGQHTPKKMLGEAPFSKVRVSGSFASGTMMCCRISMASGR